MKQDTLTILEQFAMSPEESWTDFHTHKCREISLLVEKDCFVAFADYDHQGLSTESQSERDARNTAFVNYYENSKSFPFNDYGVTNHNLARTIISLEKSLLQEYNMHTAREAFAVRSYIQNLLMINDIDKNHTLRRTNEGKLQTYMIFGTAHARSLTANLEKWGALPNPIEIKPLREYSYIAKDAAEYNTTLRQKIALRAFRILAINFGAKTDDLNQIIPEFYNSLASLESHSTGGEDTIRILCELLEINKMNYSNPDKAGKRLDDTYTRIIEGNL
jgi:hypothetical protein